MKLGMLGLSLAGVFTATTLTACGGSGSGSADPIPTTSATKIASQGQSPVIPDTDTPIASRTATYDGDKVRVEVLSLRRTGELSTLRLQITYLGTDEYSIDHDFGKSANYDVSGITLVDGSHSKRYLVARDSKDGCVCSSTITVRLKPNTSYPLSATYAAPPSDVTSVQLDIPGIGTLSNVPVN